MTVLSRPFSFRFAAGLWLALAGLALPATGATVPCVGGKAGAYDCHRVDLVSHLWLFQMAGGLGGDLWAWTDPLTSTEYALMGSTTATSFVDLSDPENPVYLGQLPGEGKDIKVYGNHAFVVGQGATSNGMEVFDLSRLRTVTNPPVTFTPDAEYTGFSTAHNIAINEETGFAYAADASPCVNGLHMVTISDPLNPTFAGCTNEGTTHDAQCVIYQGPDLAYRGREICINSNRDSLAVVDVTHKIAPATLRSLPFGELVHQGWLTEDHAYFLLDDEADEVLLGHNTHTYVFDLTDLNNPVLLGRYVGPHRSTDHNLYIRQNLVYQANFTSGLRILALDGFTPGQPKLREIAFFDTYPLNNNAGLGTGAWTAYPDLESGLILVADTSRGLFVLRPHDEPLFADGFGRGDPGRWSAVVGAAP